MSPRVTSLAILLVALASITQAQTGPPNLAALMQALASRTAYKETALSPDGHWLAWVQTASPREHQLDVGSDVFIAPVSAPSQARRVTAALEGSGAPTPNAGPIHEKSIAWSHDSRFLAFLSDARTPQQPELFMARVADGSVQQLTQLKGNLAAPQFSPADRTVALLFTENAARLAGPLAAVPASTGVVGEHIEEQRLTTVDVASHGTQQISPPDLYVYEYDWSPDGTQLVATAAKGSGDNNWYFAELVTFDAKNGTTRILLKPQKQIAVPRWSPDGRTIAFIEGLMSDEGIASGDVHLMPAGGGEDRNLTPELTASAYSLTWRKGSREIVIAEAAQGGSAIAEVDARSGAVRTLWQGSETVRAAIDLARGVSLTPEGTQSALIRESFEDPPAIWVGPIGQWHRVIPQNPGPVAPLWGRAESVQWRSEDFAVQGWLIPPASVDPAHKYPLIVYVHGGPAWLSAPQWPTPLEESNFLLLAARGYYLFLPNPRGSAGFGERFKGANVKDFGGGDLRDILSGIREVVETHPIDDRRVGLTGWSYGGYMTMWAITQTPRFRAAVVGAGLANWLSYYGENGIDEWMLPYFGASVYDDPQVYAKSSPINFIKQVRTPTLLLVGDSDVECPPPQSYEYWHALKTLNVETELVVYPHEGHEFADPAHALDVLERTLAWFDEHMPATTAATRR